MPFGSGCELETASRVISGDNAVAAATRAKAVANPPNQPSIQPKAECIRSSLRDANLIGATS